MRLVVRLEKDEVSKLILKAMAEPAKKLAPFFDTLEISFGEKNSVSISDMAATITLNRSDAFLVEKDEKAVRAILLRMAALAEIKKLMINAPFVEEILANRELIKSGFGEELFYYYYIRLANEEKTADFEKFLEISIPWLSFCSLDKSYSDFLLGQAKSFTYDRRFESMAKDFFSRVKTMKKTDAHAMARAYVSLANRRSVSAESP